MQPLVLAFLALVLGLFRSLSESKDGQSSNSDSSPLFSSYDRLPSKGLRPLSLTRHFTPEILQKTIPEHSIDTDTHTETVQGYAIVACNLAYHSLKAMMKSLLEVKHSGDQYEMVPINSLLRLPFAFAKIVPKSLSLLVSLRTTISAKHLRDACMGKGSMRSKNDVLWLDV